MSQSLRTLLRIPRVAAPIRAYHSTRLVRSPYKNSQDRESVRHGSTENTRSARDDEIATDHPDAAFNPNKTSPEEAMASTEGKDGKGGDLDASGANQKMNMPLGDEKTKASTGAGKETQKSGGASRQQSGEKKGGPSKA